MKPKNMTTVAMNINQGARKGLLYLGLLAMGQVGCQEKAEDRTPPNSGRTGMYTPSPLASTMRNMADDIEALRTKADEGSLTVAEVDVLIQAHAAMKEAEATKPDDIKATFSGYAEAYLLQLEELKSALEDHASRQERLDAFNAALATCVACHQEHCPGPIARIQKMKVQQ